MMTRCHRRNDFYGQASREALIGLNLISRSALLPARIYHIEQHKRQGTLSPVKTVVYVRLQFLSVDDGRLGNQAVQVQQSTEKKKHVTSRGDDAVFRSSVRP